MKRTAQIILIVSACCGTFFVTNPAGSAGRAEPKHTMDHWDDPYDCVGCHWERIADWSSSQMSRSYTGDFFQAQFFKYVVKDAARDPAVKDAAADCIGCHAPSAFLSGVLTPPEPALKDNFWNQAWPWPDSYRTAGQLKTGLDDKQLNEPSRQTYRNILPVAKQGADRGVFCDFCHSTVSTSDRQPFNHNYVVDAGPGRNTKRADLEFPWAPYHKTQVSELFESADLCGICHNEQNPFGVWVKATQQEWLETDYAERDIVCQWCHMPPREGKPAKMGPERPWNHAHWFGGGFSGFVEGVARTKLHVPQETVTPGTTVPLEITISDIATGHLFPTGSTEERDVWLRLAVVDVEGHELQHIPVEPNPQDPNDRYFITSNALEAYPSHSDHSDVLARDSLPEGDRIYQDVFLDSNGKVTFGQWYAVRIIGNRLEPGETRVEKYSWQVPRQWAGRAVRLRATLKYRRMADSHATIMGIEKRPHLLVSQDEKVVRIAAR
ncbi:MAG: hypothetical protein JSW27_17320 [Phycisphaerales bacterium]|nr:MAG: hypothetical protein JSW27_17320 [Phycisphaerales bacterium]